MTLQDCAACEIRMSDYLEEALDPAAQAAMDSHLSACRACSDLLAGMSEVMLWGKDFPVYDAPPWLAGRIIANTPKVVRETWLDTLAAIGRWLIEPRTAMGLLTTVLMVAWLGSLAGITPDFAAVVRDPRIVYYNAGDLMNRAYDRAVKTFYRAPLVTEIQSQIERLREIS